MPCLLFGMYLSRAELIFPFSNTAPFYVTVFISGLVICILDYIVFRFIDLFINSNFPFVCVLKDS